MEIFPTGVGGQKFGGVIPKFYLGIYLEGGGVGPGGKIPLNCLEFIFLGLIYTLTCTLVKCDTPESIVVLSAKGW